MKFIKFDSVEAIFYLIICIVIPPLFIINLIIFIIQIISNYKKNKENKQAEKEYREFEKELFLSQAFNKEELWNRSQFVNFELEDKNKLLTNIILIEKTLYDDKFLKDFYVACYTNSIKKQYLNIYINYLSNLTFSAIKDLSKVICPIQETIDILRKY